MGFESGGGAPATVAAPPLKGGGSENKLLGFKAQEARSMVVVVV